MGWVMPNFQDFILLTLIGVTGGSANLFLTQSYKLSEVSLVAPLKYLALIFAIIFGYLIWNEIPSIKTLVGASLVILASLIIFKREIYHKHTISSTTRHE
jgi:drug/metabolite transporter (DMT)-like permease